MKNVRKVRTEAFAVLIPQPCSFRSSSTPGIYLQKIEDQERRADWKKKISRQTAEKKKEIGSRQINRFQV